MKLHSFEIKSYRSCVKTTLNLHEELTGLIGINGAGKTNLLNAVQLLKKISISRNIPYKSRESIFNRCKVNLEIEHEKKLIYAKGDIFFDTDERNIDDVQFSTIKWNFKNFSNFSKWVELPMEFFFSVLRRNLHYDLSSRHATYEFWNRYSNIEKLPKKIIVLLPIIGNFFNSINYYSASQFSDPSKCPISIELDENRPIRRFKAGIGHDQFLLDLYKEYEMDSKLYKKFFNTVNKFGLCLVDDITFNKVDMPSSSYEIKTGGKIKETKRNRILIVPCFVVSGNNLSPNQLSEGTLKTLALLFYALTDDSKLLLIEEPEVCIHHGLLNSIIAIIKSQSKKKQIIISTHSDYVLDLLKPENIILVKKTDKAGTTAKLLTKSLSINAYKALHLYLEESGNLGEYWKEGGFDNE